MKAAIQGILLLITAARQPIPLTEMTRFKGLHEFQTCCGSSGKDGYTDKHKTNRFSCRISESASVEKLDGVTIIHAVMGTNKRAVGNRVTTYCY